MLQRVGWRRVTNPWAVGLVLAGSLVVFVMAWQALASGGVPDPTAGDLSPAAAVLNSGILLFREGLEAILVLAAITAGLVRSDKSYCMVCGLPERRGPRSPGSRRPLRHRLVPGRRAQEAPARRMAETTNV